MHIKIWLATTIFLLAIGCTSLAGEVIYVDDDANGANDGTSWTDAYMYLQDALIDANSAEKPIEIRIAQGTYTPDRGAYQTPGDREATFQLINGITIIGGYAGIREPDPNARNVELFETILSGDLNGDDIEVNDPCDLRNEPTRHENSDRIVNATGIDATTVLDGFTVSAGFGYWGAGMSIYQGNLTITDCTFKGNAAYDEYGGGILTRDGNPTLVKCTFTKNYAEVGGGMCSISSSPILKNCQFTNNYAIFGAGMYNMHSLPKVHSSRDSNSTLIDCTFIDNNARFRGGGMYNGGSDSNLSNCTFSGNSSLVYGAGIYNRGSNHIMIDCTFSRNKTFDGDGGGIWNDDVNELTLANCTFSNNSSKFYGGGIAGKTNKAMMINCLFVGNKVYGEPGKPYDIGRGGGLASYGDTILANCTFAGNWARNGRAIFNDSSLKLYNCVLWGSDNEIFDPIQDSMAFIAYSNIQNGWEGTDNINEDPLFANPGYWADADDPNIAVEPNDPNAVWIDGDYHLKSQAGRWDPNSQIWIQDDVTSPCIDAGDPNSPIGHEPFPNGGIINMGAYGGTVGASKSYFGGPVCETIIAGDINGDCKVDFDDLMILMAHWLEDHNPKY